MEDIDITILIDRLDRMFVGINPYNASEQAHIQFPAFDGPNPFNAFVCFTLSEYIGYVVDHK